MIFLFRVSMFPRSYLEIQNTREYAYFKDLWVTIFTIEKCVSVKNEKYFDEINVPVCRYSWVWTDKSLYSHTNSVNSTA